MEGFLNRYTEKAMFDSLLANDKASFAIVYGRRRIGKSSLLRQILKTNGIYFLADLTEKSIQIENLAIAISSVIPDFDKVHYPSWEILFTSFNNQLKSKTTLVLDEFPYLVSSASELPSIIQKLVDLSKHDKFNLIVCGSSQQMMRNLFLGTTSPLYGRADAIANITAMNAYWIKEYLHCSAVESVKEFATWGGVPRYWEIRKQYKSLKEALKNSIFDKNGILFEEPMRLFLDDMRSVVQAYSIVQLVGNGNHRISEIAAKLEKPATHFSRPLANLIEMGYLKKEIPFGEPERDSKKSLYQIADPFLNFYMQFVSPNKSLIELGLWDVISEQMEIKLPHLYANVWENLVRQSIPNLKVYDDIQFGKAYRYWGKPDKKNEIEIDVLAESIDKSTLLIGEVKWSNKPNVFAIEKSLDSKLQILGIAHQYKRVIRCIFSISKPTDVQSNSMHYFDCEDVISVLK
ncbi:MAG: ATP-binding protein [Bacteroidota bacterium]|nr:ATP-binding protein [Bacteroidota bacterium]